MSQSFVIECHSERHVSSLTTERNVIVKIPIRLNPKKASLGGATGLLVFGTLLSACKPQAIPGAGPGIVPQATSGSESALAFSMPTPLGEGGTTLTVRTTVPSIVRVGYFSGSTPLSEGMDAAQGFPARVSLPAQNRVSLTAIGYNSTGQELARTAGEFEVKPSKVEGSPLPDTTGTATGTPTAPGSVLAPQPLQATCCSFPLAKIPTENWHEEPARFGAGREGGNRLHAATDLYAPVGTPIYAVGDGEVIDSYEFYLGTDAVEVQHKDFLVRYGEIARLAPGIKQGSKVKQGQLIAYVGRLQGLDYYMVHFEMYSGRASGPLSTQSGKYRRRSDLMDPTKYVDSWKSKLPK